LRILGVDLDAFLRAIRTQEEIVVFARIFAEVGARSLDRLDFDDLRAVVAEDLSAEWTRQVAGEADYLGVANGGASLIAVSCEF
jgi:hypothetical protein